MKRICVFCGAHTGNGQTFARTAASTARAIVAAGHGIVYGGGRVGLMGILADAALASGGNVIGVIPASLANREIAHDTLTKLYVTEGMHERKLRMTELADAFLALPGGYGTMDELFEALTWRQLGLHNKPIAALNIAGYYDGLVQQIDRMVRDEFVNVPNRELLWNVTSADEFISRLSW